MKTKKDRVLYKGGGGTTQTIPDWAVPYLEAVGRTAEQAYGRGDLGNVAGSNPLIQAASQSGGVAIADRANLGYSQLDDQASRLTDAATSGGYDTSALKDAAITEAGVRTADLGRQYGAAGTLGSARQQVHQAAQDAATAAQFASIDQQAAQQNFQNRMAAESALGQNIAGGSGLAINTAQALSNLGAQGRQIEQETGDAAWQALQRYATTIYGNPA